jgi:hypothetical protein
MATTPVPPTHIISTCAAGVSDLVGAVRLQATDAAELAKDEAGTQTTPALPPGLSPLPLQPCTRRISLPDHRV